MLKKNKIGRSAAKFLSLVTLTKYEKGSTTISEESTLQAIGSGSAK